MRVKANDSVGWVTLSGHLMFAATTDGWEELRYEYDVYRNVIISSMSSSWTFSSRRVER